MKCSHCKPYKMHIEGLEFCFSFNFSSPPTWRFLPSPLFPVSPAHVHQCWISLARGIFLPATLRGSGLLRAVSAGAPGGLGLPERPPRCVRPPRRLLTCFQAGLPPRAQRECSGRWKIRWEETRPCVQEGRKLGLPRPPGGRAAVQRSSKISFGGLILGQALMSHRLCGSHGQHDQNKVSVF